MTDTEAPRFYTLEGVKELNSDCVVLMANGNWKKKPKTTELLFAKCVARPMTAEEIESQVVEECCAKICDGCKLQESYGVPYRDGEPAFSRRSNWFHGAPINGIPCICIAMYIREHFYQNGIK